MENKKVVEEFVTKHREHKPPYTIDKEKMTITIDRRIKKTPADEKEIEMLNSDINVANTRIANNKENDESREGSADADHH